MVAARSYPGLALDIDQSLDLDLDVDPLTEVLNRFAAATPAQLAQRELLSRVDSKFVIKAPRLGDLLDQLTRDYTALRVPSGNIASYRSLYFDSPDLTCFHDHRRGKRLRHKVRIRHYPDRQLSFLEVKTKRNEAITDKLRLDLPYGTTDLGDRELAYLRGLIGELADRLEPQVWINYRRVSLLGLHSNERFTIDLDLEVVGADRLGRHLTGFTALNDLAIVEVKQAPFCVRTPVMRALLGAHVPARSLSKYSTVIAMTRPELARNRLLPDLRALERMTP